MNYVILLKNRQKQYIEKIEEYLTLSGFTADKTLAFEEFCSICEQFKQSDFVLMASVVTLGNRWKDFVQNVRRLFK